MRVVDDTQVIVYGLLGVTQHREETLLRRALALAVEQDLPVHDTLFVALAETEGARVVTCDRLLRNRFPAWCVSPGEVV